MPAKTTRPIILTDLDDTLFQTIAKCPDDQLPLTPMSTLESGEVSGYATPRQRAFLDWLQEGDVIPVTNRSAAVLARVNLTWTTAVCAAGGVIMEHGGSNEPYWRARVRLHSGCGKNVDAVHDALRPVFAAHGNDIRHWAIADDGASVYLCAKSQSRDLARLVALAADLRADLPAGWRIHTNGNNLALLPAWVDKRQAVRHLLTRLRRDHPDRPIIAIGDSHSDTGFMDLADYAVMPTRSQAWALLQRDNPWIS